MKLTLTLAVSVLMVFCFFINTNDIAYAEEVLGTGTGSLIGGDLTDPEDDGQPDVDQGYNAKFSSSEEPGFGGGEFAFNVFDNQLGPGNAKWC